jgi:hypothetical protein
VGGTVNAEDTAAALQRAARGGPPVLIPGGLEPRAGRPLVAATTATAVPVTPHAGAATADNRERLEHERAGGGAPSERTGMPHKTMFAKLWPRLFGN